MSMRRSKTREKRWLMRQIQDQSGGGGGAIPALFDLSWPLSESSARTTTSLSSSLSPQLPTKPMTARSSSVGRCSSSTALQPSSSAPAPSSPNGSWRRKISGGVTCVAFTPALPPPPNKHAVHLHHSTAVRLALSAECEHLGRGSNLAELQSKVTLKTPSRMPERC